MGPMTGTVLGAGNLTALFAEVQPYLPDGHPPVHAQTSTGVALAIAAGLIVLSVVGGYYVTRGVLHLAARTGAAEAASGPASGAPTGPASPEPTTAGPSTPGSAPSAGGAAGDPAASATPGPADPGPTGPTAVAALRGGTWIGILERLAVTGLILVGYPGGIAILVAIKGLGRYPELKDNPGASERFVVGTLASIVWAAGLGVLGLWWIG